MKIEKKIIANFPGIGKVEISIDRAKQILNLQKIIREQRIKKK